MIKTMCDGCGEEADEKTAKGVGVHVGTFEARGHACSKECYAPAVAKVGDRAISDALAAKK